MNKPNDVGARSDGDVSALPDTPDMPPPAPPGGRAFSPVGPPTKRRRQTWRQTGTAILCVAMVSILAVGSVTLLGRNASSKFSSVASAIGGGGGSSRGAETANRSAPTSASGAAPSTVASNDAAAVASPEATPAAVPSLDAAPVPVSPSAGHAFISTATMTVKVDDADGVNQKKEEAVRLVEASGGALFGEQTSFSGEAQATITFKVPPAAFRPMLSTLAGLGTLQAQEVKTDDVTQQVIDLDARIIAAQEGLDRMRVLLSSTTDINKVNTLEAEVSRRHTEVEQLLGQQRTLAQRVDLSTIVLTVTTSSKTTPATTAVAAPKEPKPLPGFSDGLDNGWRVFTTGGTVVLACVGASLPFLPFVIVAFVMWRALRRRRTATVRPA